MFLGRAKARAVEGQMCIAVVRLRSNRFGVFDDGAVVVLCPFGTLSEVIGRGRRASAGCEGRKQPDRQAPAAQVSATSCHCW
jgi:hypothetical protein